MLETCAKGTNSVHYYKNSLLTLSITDDSDLSPPDKHATLLSFIAPICNNQILCALYCLKQISSRVISAVYDIDSMILAL